MKKGQVSIFVIVAAIVIVIVIFFFLRGDLGDMRDTKLRPVESMILDCADDVTQDSLNIIGIQGGFYNEPPRNLDIEGVYIPYYYYEGEFLMPENSFIEGELADLVNDYLGFCIDNLEIKDHEITYSKPSTTVLIKEEEVSFNIDMMVDIKKGEMTSQLNLAEYPANKPSALGKILDVAAYLTDSHLEETICLTCLYDMLDERELFLDFTDFGNSSTLVVFSENKTSEDLYVFEFLNKYTEEELESESIQFVGRETAWS